MWPQLINNCRVLAILLCVLSFFPGCRATHVNEVGTAAPQTTEAQKPGFTAFLPNPAELRASEEPARRTSYTELDFIKHGAEYSGSLVKQNILPGTDNSVEFKPSWLSSGTSTSANLAYCIYKYTIPGYDRGAELRYQWLILPPSYDSVWFGIANWDKDRWDWVLCEPDGVSDFGDYVPYFDPGGNIYVVVVCANDGDNVLRYLRLGEVPPANISLELSKPYPVPSISVSISAAGSILPVGSIEAYAWDLDGNGSFEVDTGTNAQTSTVFNAVGVYPVNVRLTSSYRECFTGSLAVEVIGPWTHSWGTDLFQDIQAITTDGNEFCYSVGSSATAANGTDALLLKHNLGGELVWAATWGGVGNDSLADVIYENGSIYTVGRTESYGAGNYDMLIQRWDTDGNIVWSRVVGTAVLDQAAGVAVAYSDLYIVGSTAASGTTDVFMLSLGKDNSYNWARTWGGSGSDEATDVIVLDDSDILNKALLMTGKTNSPNPLYQDVFFLQVDTAGSPQVERIWRSDSETKQAGQAIYGGMYYDLGYIFIGGHLGTGSDRQALLLEVGSGTGSMARAWTNGKECLGYAVLERGNGVYLAGRSGELGVSSGGFVLEFDIMGNMLNQAWWADGDLGTGLVALCRFPGKGLLAAGNCQAAAAGSWSEPAGIVTTPAGTWSDYSGTSGFPLLSFALPTPAVQKITGGAEDTGGGSWDALVTMPEFPQ